MLKLNFPEYQPIITNKAGKLLIHDPVRKKSFVLTPEEWVRQHLINFLVKHKNISLNLISIEKQITYNFRTKRFDLLVYDREGHPYLMAECKSPMVRISQSTLEQIAVYNFSLKLPFLMVTNGIEHFYFSFDKENEKYVSIKSLPDRI